MNTQELRAARESGAQPSAPNSNLRGANLRGADLRGANLYGANLRGANHALSIVNLPSGTLIMVPTSNGWHIQLGCWSGSIDELATLTAGNDWPAARGDEIARRRPFLDAAIVLCRLHAEANQAALDAVAHWGEQ